MGEEGGRQAASRVLVREGGNSVHVFVGAHNVVMAAVQCSVTNASHKAPSFWQVITGGITGLLGWLFYLVGSLVWIVAI